MASAAGDPRPSTKSPRSAWAASRGPSSPRSHAVRAAPSAAPPPSASPDAEPPDCASSSVADPAPPQAEIAEHDSNGNAAAADQIKKPAWNVLSNGSIDVGADMMLPSVMGAAWPTLSESTKASSKSSSSDSLKALSDGYVTVTTGPLISSLPAKTSLSIPNPNSAPNHMAPVRHKSSKRGGGVGRSGALPNVVPALSSPPAASAMMPEIMQDKPDFQQPSPKGLHNNATNSSDHGGRGSGFTHQPHGGNDHHRNYGSNRRGNNGGGGPHHNNYGNRRNQERGGNEWKHRNFNGRGVQMQPPPPPPAPPLARPYLRPLPPIAPPFITPPQQVRPFPGPMGYHDMPSPMYYFAVPQPPEVFRGPPFVPHPPPPPFLLPVLDPLRAKLVTQIEYYFSPDNLCKDPYLRKNMDNQGWVPITLIAGFNLVKEITENIQYILETLWFFSAKVDVQGDKVRKRGDWMRWLLPPARDHFSNSAPQSPATPNSDTLVARFQTVGLDGSTNQQSTRESPCNEVVITRSASGNLST